MDLSNGSRCTYRPRRKCSETVGFFRHGENDRQRAFRAAWKQPAPGGILLCWNAVWRNHIFTLERNRRTFSAIRSSLGCSAVSISRRRFIQQSVLGHVRSDDQCGCSWAVRIWLPAHSFTSDWQGGLERLLLRLDVSNLSLKGSSFIGWPVFTDTMPDGCFDAEVMLVCAALFRWTFAGYAWKAANSSAGAIRTACTGLFGVDAVRFAPLLAFRGIGARIWRDAVTTVLRFRQSCFFHRPLPAGSGDPRVAAFSPRPEERNLPHHATFWCLGGCKSPWWKHARARGSPSGLPVPVHQGCRRVPKFVRRVPVTIQTGTFQLMAYDLLHAARAQASAGAA